MNFQAPTAFAVISTRSGVFTADANGLISNVPASGTALADLVASGCVPVSSSPVSNFRNILDGGDFTVNPWQRNLTALGSGNSIATPITNTVTYFPDRFFGVGGSSSSLGLGQSADTTVPGFSQSLFMSRTTGSNTAPLQIGQVVETLDAVRLQGQLVTFSFWARTGATYSGGPLTVQVISGTGTNQSAANMVAAAWTNQANVINTTQALTSSMTRYSFSAIVPTNATQLGVLLTWTPTGTASGSTDGIFFNGFQLEAGGLSPFEHRDVQVELEICQRYCWTIPEPASGVVVGAGTSTGTNVQTFYMATPVQLIKAPTVTFAAGSFKVALAAGFVAATTLAAGTTHTPNAISMTTANTATAGFGALLGGGGGVGYIMASADF